MKKPAMFDMANLRPEETGVPVALHVLKDIEHRARHAPRIKAFPGRPHEGRATVIAIPTRSGVNAEVIGRATVRGRRLRAVLDFVERNWRPLLLYWYEPEYDRDDLLADLEEP